MNSSKQKVIDAASLLFFRKGFHGASVREIAEQASVNVSLISYYFKGKQGLLEYSVTKYYETYLAEIEGILQETETQLTIEKLKRVIAKIMQFKQQHLHLSCIIHRELSIDSIFVRELTVTYLAKENHFLSSLLFDILKEKRKKGIDQHFLLMQLKGMLVTPYVLHNEWKYRVIGDHSHHLFVQKYVQSIHQWLDFIIGKNDEKMTNYQ